MSANNDNPANTTPEDTAQALSCKKPVVIGLYGVPGSGKTWLLERLKGVLDFRENYMFFEGSQAIDAVMEGGLEAFQALDFPGQESKRITAIDYIRREAMKHGKMAIVTGHFMFWPERKRLGQNVQTRRDLDVYTHIIYLHMPAETVESNQRADDRHRDPVSLNHLKRWQEVEMTELRERCAEHGIMFSIVSSPLNLLDEVSTIIRNFEYHCEEKNLALVQRQVDEIFDSYTEKKETMLVLDGDRTLTDVDTGAVFWSKRELENPLIKIFSGPLPYSFSSFRRVASLYEQMSGRDFETTCEAVAYSVHLYPEFESLLRRLSLYEHVGIVVLSCGLSRVWEMVIEKIGLSDVVKIIGGRRSPSGLIVDASVKAAVVNCLHQKYRTRVWAFGDSPLDLQMLDCADEAIVVVGKEQTRSKTMEDALQSAIKNGLNARQVLLPSDTTARLATVELPIVRLDDESFIDSIVRQPAVPFLHATSSGPAKLLSTPMRDASLSGPQLREAHYRVGEYLAVEFLTRPDVIGIEEYPIPHVQGMCASGFRLRHERYTTIVAIMRGGEPMARGVAERFPSAMFVHAKDENDVKCHHLHNQQAIILVDSVINSGQTIVDFLQHIRELHPHIRIVVVAGVVQSQAVAGLGISQTLARQSNFMIVGLRLSDNKFTGTGATDTGNRLFNTTHLA